MRRGPRVTATNRLVTVTAMSHDDGNLHTWTSSDAGQTWTEGAPLTPPAKGCTRSPETVAAGRGGLARFARRRDGSARRLSRDGGSSWGEDVSIYQSPDGHVCECCVPNVAISPRGEIAVNWRNWLGGSRDIYLARSSDSGRTFSSTQKLGTGTWKLGRCPMDDGAVAYSPAGEWIAAWRRERTVCEQRADRRARTGRTLLFDRLR